MTDTSRNYITSTGVVCVNGILSTSNLSLELLSRNAKSLHNVMACMSAPFRGEVVTVRLLPLLLPSLVLTKGGCPPQLADYISEAYRGRTSAIGAFMMLSTHRNFLIVPLYSDYFLQLREESLLFRHDPILRFFDGKGSDIFQKTVLDAFKKAQLSTVERTQLISEVSMLEREILNYDSILAELDKNIRAAFFGKITDQAFRNSLSQSVLHVLRDHERDVNFPDYKLF